MRTIFLNLLILISIQLSAQLKYKYNNPNLNLPEWLTNPNYISENKPEEGIIDIEEIDLALFSKFTIVELRLYKTQNNVSHDSFYLGTFDKNKRIVDIVPVAEVSSTDWNWQGELSFQEIEPGIVKYYCIDLLYRPAEPNEDQTAEKGMVLSKSDTTTTFFKIDKNGKIIFSSDLEQLKNLEYQPIKPDLSQTSNDDLGEEVYLQKIRQLCVEINKNSSSYQKKVKKIGENITINSCYDGNLLKKIVESNSSNGQSLEYFYDSNAIIFIYSFNKTNKSESRYYFQNSKLMKWLKGAEKVQISKDSNEFKEREKELLSRSSKLMQN
jgi:hypothetical protein